LKVIKAIIIITRACIWKLHVHAYDA